MVSLHNNSAIAANGFAFGVAFSARSAKLAVRRKERILFGFYAAV